MATIQSEATLDELDLNVKTITGKLINIKIGSLRNIFNLKQVIYMLEDIPIDAQRIIFNGKELKNIQTFDELNIVSSSELHMIIRLRGGMFHQISSRNDYLSHELKQKIIQSHNMIETSKEYYSSLQLDITVFDDLKKELIKYEKQNILNKSDEDNLLKLCDLIKKYYLV